MKLTNGKIKELYNAIYEPCKDICKVSLVIEDDFEGICQLCYENNNQFFVPTDEFAMKINKILEEK